MSLVVIERRPSEDGGALEDMLREAVESLRLGGVL